jgi:hypothetical protein
MPMSRIRLKFKDICHIMGSGGTRGLILLVDTADTRQLAVPCDERIINEFLRRTGNPKSRSRMMPEALWRLMKQQGDASLEILIDGLLPTGNYNALLIQSHTLTSQPIDITDAVLLSFASDGEIPIYIEENFYRRQSTQYSTEQNSIQVPLDVMNIDTIKMSLDKAIKDENYELAALLKKELSTRQQKDEEQHRAAEELKKLRRGREGSSPAEDRPSTEDDSTEHTEMPES